MRIRNKEPWEATQLDKDLYDSILMAIRKHIEDYPNEEISVERIHNLYNYQPKDIKTVLYYHLFVGDLRCETYTVEGSIERRMRIFNVRLDGSHYV